MSTATATDPRRQYGDKPAYGERKFGDKPRYEHRDGDKPRRQYGDKPAYGERKFGDKKYGDRKFGDKPYKPGPRKHDDKPASYPKFTPEKQVGEMRLNRFLAQSGLCSRREADDFFVAAGPRYGQRPDRHPAGHQGAFPPTR